MRRTAGPVTGWSLLPRLLLVVALGAGLSAMHVLAAAVGPQRTSGHASSRTAGDAPGHVGSAPPHGLAPVSGAVASTGGSTEPHEAARAGARLGEHDHHPTGECVLFLSAGVALVLVLLARSTAQALRASYRLAGAWPRQRTATTPWRGPPPWRWPRVALCVIRV
ncbi:hypothetical protein [Kineococcus terrestris]|uniref:hypothetical protein n=1 Tax=Kineococcus terrestris TaxID=2044856 RepID=UPI0034DB5555